MKIPRKSDLVQEEFLRVGILICCRYYRMANFLEHPIKNFIFFMAFEVLRAKLKGDHDSLELGDQHFRCHGQIVRTISHLLHVQIYRCRIIRLD